MWLRLSGSRTTCCGGWSELLKVKEVTNLGQTISDVLKRDVQGWQHPHRTEITPDRPKKVHRAEYYEWLLDLSANERLVRYGCDGYFNRLKKKPRLVHVKMPKKRPYPIWLSPYMFGGHSEDCNCRECQACQTTSGTGPAAT
jgi:hypothetical protein